MEKLKELKNKLLLLSLMSMLSTNITGCGNNNETELKDNEAISLEDIMISYSESDESVVSTSEQIAELEDVIVSSEEIIVGDIESSYDEIEFEDTVIDTKEEVMDLINSGSVKKVYYVTEDTNINIPSFLSNTGVEENILLPKLECLEVYDEADDMYLVKTNEYIGYVNSTNLEELLGTFVVVDISSQEVKLYCDNEVVLTSSVVTGKPSTPSDQGIFEIYDISGPRYLVGPNYKSYVDVMMKYNGGEGLHDAEYHKHEDGFKHGWRGQEEFGGETYLTDGSHGCINMLREDVMIIKDHVEIGTKVLVKQ